MINTETLACDDILELRNKQLHLLDELAKVCSKHSLTYWIDFGTLLGAARNGKFIPWDDDIDVSMPLEDYKKFIGIAQRELPSNIFVQNPSTDPHFRQPFTKLRDSGSTFIEQNETGEENYHHGIFLDISPSINYPWLPKLIRKVLMRYTVRTGDRANINYNYRYVNLVFYWILRFIWSIILIYPKKNYFGQVPYINGYMCVVPLEYLYPLKPIEFEGRTYFAPNKYKKHLEVMYGENFMTPPPPQRQVTHAKRILTSTPYRPTSNTKTGNYI